MSEIDLKKRLLDHTWQRPSIRWVKQLRQPAKETPVWPKLTSDGGVICPAAVVMMDVLGMKALLRSHTLEAIHTRVMKPLLDSDDRANSSVDENNTDEAVEAFLALGYEPMLGAVSAAISDTVLIAVPIDWYEMDDSRAGYEAVVEAGRAFARAIEFSGAGGIWFRGAIAFGECLFSTRGSLIMLGDPVREAFDWEKGQDWIGGMLAPSAAAALGDPGSAPWFVEYEVPLKPNAIRPQDRTIAIDWTYGRTAEREIPIPRPPSSANADVRRKFSNTLEFVQAMEKRWRGAG